MSRFTGPLSMTSMDIDCREWQLDEELVYERGELGSGRLVRVPSGFVTDGASIPWPLRGLLPPWGRYSRAAVVHDYLVRSGLLRVKEADSVFFEAMLVSGVSRPLAVLLWGAVRLRAVVLGYRTPTRGGSVG